jgi:hypothetical protein
MYHKNLRPDYIYCLQILLKANFDFKLDIHSSMKIYLITWYIYKLPLFHCNLTFKSKINNSNFHIFHLKLNNFIIHNCFIKRSWHWGCIRNYKKFSLNLLFKIDSNMTWLLLDSICQIIDLHQEFIRFHN